MPCRTALFLLGLQALAITTPQDTEPLPRDATGCLGSVSLQHPDRVTHCAFSPDGLRLASLGYRDGLRVWDVRTGREISRRPSTADIALAYGKDGKLSVLQVVGAEVIWLEVESGRELFRGPHRLGRTDTCRGSIQSASSTIAFTDGSVGPRAVREGKVSEVSRIQNWMWCMVLSADGELVAAADGEGGVGIWRTAKGELVTQAKRHERNAWAVAFSPDGRTVASGGDKDICIQDLRGTELRRIAAGATVHSLAFSPDGKSLAAGLGEEIQIFEPETGRMLRKLVGHSDQVLSLAFSPDGKRLASGGYDCTLRLWDLATGAPTIERPGHQGRITSLALSPDGKRLLTSSVDKTVRIWDLATRRSLLVLRDTSDVRRALFMPDGNTVLSQGSAIRLWDARTGEPQPCKVLEEEALRAVALYLSPDGARLVGTHEAFYTPGSGTLYLWDVATGKRLYLYKWGADSQLSTAFSPDGRIFATAGEGEEIQFWDTATGSCRRDDLKIERHSIIHLAFSSDGKALVVGSHAKEGEPHLRLLDWQTGATLVTFGKGEDYITSVALSPDGRLLGTLGHDSRVRLWEVDSGSEIADIPGGPDRQWSLAFAGDSRVVLLNSYETVRVFDLAAGRDLLRVPAGDNVITPDGGTLARVEGAAVLLYKVARPHLEGDRDVLWEDLKSKDHRKACRAVWALGDGKAASQFLRERILSECAPSEEKSVRTLVEKLNSDEIETRTKATEALASFGEEIAPLLRKIRDESLAAEARARVDELLDRCGRVKSPRLLARFRAIQALELSGASGVLKELSDKLPTEEERRRVREALGRLGTR